MKQIMKAAIAAAMPAVLFAACSDDNTPEVLPTDYETVEGAKTYPMERTAGFYLVNEGNMGSNKCTLDWFDFGKSMYVRNIYPERNPQVAMELGDTGNDIAIDGSRLYVVVNGSNKVEVMDASTGVRLGQIDIASPRYIKFHNGFAYVTSYVGGEGNCGSVVKVDPKTLRVVDTLSVGLQPEEMEVADGHLFVANSMSLTTYEYDRNVTAIDLETFKKDYDIPVAINMHLLRKDSEGNLWVSSRGNYADVASSLFKLSKGSDGRYAVVKDAGVGVSNMAVDGDRIYYFSNEWSNATMSFTLTYGTLDTKTGERINSNFITDGTEKNITTPYAIAVNPENGDIYVTDVKNYASSGALHVYGRDGKLKWSVARTGDIPGRIAFLAK